MAVTTARGEMWVFEDRFDAVGDVPRPAPGGVRPDGEGHRPGFVLCEGPTEESSEKRERIRGIPFVFPWIPRFHDHVADGSLPRETLEATLTLAGAGDDDRTDPPDPLRRVQSASFGDLLGT